MNWFLEELESFQYSRGREKNPMETSHSKTKTARDLACHRANAIEMTQNVNLSKGHITVFSLLPRSQNNRKLFPIIFKTYIYIYTLNYVVKYFLLQNHLDSVNPVFFNTHIV